MRDLCVTFYGLIQMIDVAGAYLLEALDTLLARYLISRNSLIIGSFYLFGRLLSILLLIVSLYGFYFPGHIGTV